MDQNCLEKKLESAWSMMHEHPGVEENSRAWQLIANANRFDMKLYDYAKEIFDLQGRQMFSQ